MNRTNHSVRSIFDDTEEERESLRGPKLSKVSLSHVWCLARVMLTENYILKEDMLDRQTRDIEELSKHVSAVSHMTGLIYDQIVQSSQYVILTLLKVHKILLLTFSSIYRDIDGLEQGMDSSRTRLEQITNRTKGLVNRAGGPRYCCIIMFLSTTAIILLMLVLYT
jgi:hypothetical protein